MAIRVLVPVIIWISERLIAWNATLVALNVNKQLINVLGARKQESKMLLGNVFVCQAILIPIKHFVKV